MGEIEDVCVKETGQEKARWNCCLWCTLDEGFYRGHWKILGADLDGENIDGLRCESVWLVATPTRRRFRDSSPLSYCGAAQVQLSVPTIYPIC